VVEVKNRKGLEIHCFNYVAKMNDYWQKLRKAACRQDDVSHDERPNMTNVVIRDDGLVAWQRAHCLLLSKRHATVRP